MCRSTGTSVTVVVLAEPKALSWTIARLGTEPPLWHHARLGVAPLAAIVFPLSGAWRRFRKLPWKEHGGAKSGLRRRRQRLLATSRHGHREERPRGLHSPMRLHQTHIFAPCAL